MTGNWEPRETLAGRGFWAFIVTQFQGAFNDNLYKFIILYHFLRNVEGTGPKADELRATLTGLSVVLFAIPYLVFPGIEGALADRFSKRSVAIATKLWEVGVMVLALVAFQVDIPPFIWAIFFLMSMQSAFFSPAKYGILPEMLSESRLSSGNGILNMASFGAIIAGMAVAGLFYKYDLSTLTMSVVLIALSAIGLGASLMITRVPAADPGRRIPWNPWAGLAGHYKAFHADRVLFQTLIGGAFFWFVGAIVQANVVNYSDSRGYDEWHTSLLAAAIAIGIGVGSVAAGYLSRKKIELGLVPIGLGGMAVFSALCGLPGLGFQTFAALLFLTGFASGFFEVPLMATIQHRSPSLSKGGMIAALNVCTSGGILLGGGALLLFGRLHLDPATIFVVVAGLCVLAGVYLCVTLPVFVLRSLLWCAVNTVYRVRLVGRENVPEKGGALLIANHTTFVDALFLTAAIDRPIRFLLSAELYQKLPWLRFLANLSGAIPIASTASPREIAAALQKARDAINGGQLVCVFAEGQISRTGNMLPFRKGYEKIMRGVEAPIVPVYLDRLWGSIFSYAGHKFFWKWPRKVPYPVTVCVGQAMPGNTDAFTLRQTIRELGSDAWNHRELMFPILHRGFVRNARKHPGRRAFADATSGTLSYGKALIATVIFARKLRPLVGSERMVGVIVPPSVGGALTNLALHLLGRVPVNLNYTATNEALASAAEQCGITHVITSRKVLERLPLEVPGETVFLEDVRKTVSGKDRITSMLMAFTLPVRVLEWAVGSRHRWKPDDIATVIFSSGSEGRPKGVPLTQFNVSSNVECTLQVFPHEEDECIVGILPFFHSFGYTVTIWLTLLAGWSAIYHPSPLEPKAIGQLIYEHRATFLIVAPTFLQNFLRRCLPEELSSIRHVITGAEKLPGRLREAFRDTFGVEPLEGYGTTECSPVVSVNVPDRRAPGYYQVGTKHGTIGQPIPGVSARVMDPDTCEPLGQDEAGMLLIKGPNIMNGYLDDPERTAKSFHGEWYITGDIAAIDEDGFITITDRLARFSKIGGEMIPHTRIEDSLHALLGLSEQALAVTGVPDESKGERLVVLHTLSEEQEKELLEKLPDSDLPNLWRPRASAFHRIDEIPVLGTGKLNLRAVKEQAKQLEGVDA